MVIFDDNQQPQQRDASMMRQKLAAHGVHVMEPATKQGEAFAEALHDFAEFVLEEDSEASLALLEEHVVSAPHTVGYLQGGSSEYDIYRVSIRIPRGSNYDDVSDDDTVVDNDAAHVLLRRFHSSGRGKRYTTILTMQKLQDYMLQMCNTTPPKKNKNLKDEDNGIKTMSSPSSYNYYTRLTNLMFILSFGPVPGQVRHIDAMDPNLQIGLYMSPDCPTTRIFGMKKVLRRESSAIGRKDNLNNEDPTCASSSDDAYEDEDDCAERMTSSGNITDVDSLLSQWEVATASSSSSGGGTVPRLVRNLLRSLATTPLRTAYWHTKKFFGFWGTLNATLRNFGKLYQQVECEMGLTAVAPGTTLVSGGIEVHAGPPTTRPRMFAFAVGIPTSSSKDRPQNQQNGTKDNDDDGLVDLLEKYGEEMDGEMQYSPVLFHVDLTCLLFGMMEYEVNDNDDKIQNDVYESKRFLVQVLVDLMQTCPNEPYHVLVTEERAALRNWLIQMADAISRGQSENRTRINQLIEAAIGSNEILFVPDVSQKLKKRRNGKKNKKNRTSKGTKSAQRKK